VSGICADSMAVTANAIFTTMQAGAKIVAYNLDGSGEREVMTEQGGILHLVAGEDATLFYYLGDEVIELDFN
jgi:hypothetical protein